MEILKTDPLMQLINSCKHINHFFLGRYNLNGFLSAEWRTTASRSVKLSLLYLLPATFYKPSLCAMPTPTLGKVHLPAEINILEDSASLNSSLQNMTEFLGAHRSNRL